MSKKSNKSPCNKSVLLTIFALDAFYVVLDKKKKLFTFLAKTNANG